MLYQVGSDSTFETDCQYTGDIYAVDVATKTVRRLDILDGYTGSSAASYLPASDPGLNFAPTMLPEAVGGYFWAIFTSHRSYGSMLASKANSAGLGLSNCFSAQGDEANGKLWVAAIDIGAAPGTDPSHPAFYLDGQELQADNLRGYWVLPACQAHGDQLRIGRPVLQRLLPRGRRWRSAVVRAAAQGMRERVRELHDGLELLRLDRPVHQRSVRHAGAGVDVEAALGLGARA